MSDHAQSMSLRIRNVDEINNASAVPQRVLPDSIKVETNSDDAEAMAGTPAAGPSADLVETQMDTQVPSPTLNGETVDNANASNGHEPASQEVKIKTEVKEEPVDQEPDVVVVTPSAPAIANNRDNKPAVLSRPCCRHGVKCYRNNGSHRAAESHPGDSDYKMPVYPPPPPGTPNCPYGTSCYRRNPVHFQQFSHSGPPTKPSGAPPPKRRRLDTESQSTDSEDGSMLDFLDDDDEDDEPFPGEGSDDDDYLGEDHYESDY